MAEQVARAVAGGANESTPLTKQNSFGSSHYDLEYNPMLNDKQIIADFRFRVYALLSAQLVVTAAMGVWMALTETGMSVGRALHSGPAGILLSILSLVLIIALFCYKDRYPANLILFSGLTLILGSGVGFVSAMVSTIGKANLVNGKCVYDAGVTGSGLMINGLCISKGTEIVLLALALTSTIFISLTIYVVWSKKDFSFLGGFLFVCLLSTCVVNLIGFLLGLALLKLLCCIAFIMIFTGYILYDTDQIVNKVQLQDMDMGTALSGALELYLDVINLFIEILKFLVIVFGDRD